MSTLISIKDFRRTLAHIADAVEKGETYTVMRRSRPAFVVQPFVEDEEFGWKTALDFTRKGKTKGIRAKRLLAAMKKFEGKNG